MPVASEKRAPERKFYESPVPANDNEPESRAASGENNRRYDGNASGPRVYAYAGGDPINLTDPSGMCDGDDCDDIPTINVTDTRDPGDSGQGDIVGVTNGGNNDFGTITVTAKKLAQTLPPVNLPLPQTNPCTLTAPTGQYRTSSGVDARFNPTTAQMLSTALANLNQQGITPVITSGYRSPALQGGLATSNSPFVITPAQVSWHEVGAAVDFGPNSNAGNFPAIQNAMTQAGFMWGGNFRTPDAPHFQSQPPGTSPSAAMVQACAGAASGG